MHICTHDECKHVYTHMGTTHKTEKEKKQYNLLISLLFREREQVKKFLLLAWNQGLASPKCQFSCLGFQVLGLQKCVSKHFTMISFGFDNFLCTKKVSTKTHFINHSVVWFNLFYPSLPRRTLFQLV